MSRPAGPPCGRCRPAAAVLCACLVATSAALGGEEPGPVPLVSDTDPATPLPAARPAKPAGLGDWPIVAALGAAFAVLVAVRMTGTRRSVPPPADVFEVLGTASLGGQHAVRIVRFGPKTLLVGVSNAGAATLAEIADPQSTARIVAACGGSRSPPRDRGPAAPPEPRPTRGEAA